MDKEETTAVKVRANDQYMVKRLLKESPMLDEAICDLIVWHYENGTLDEFFKEAV